jgi:hypothetical protein
MIVRIRPPLLPLVGVAGGVVAGGVVAGGVVAGGVVDGVVGGVVCLDFVGLAEDETMTGWDAFPDVAAPSG